MAVSSRRNGSGARAVKDAADAVPARRCTRSVGQPHRAGGGGARGGSREAPPVPASGPSRDGRVCARAAPLAPMRIPARRRALG